MQIGGAKSFGEPLINRCQQIARLTDPVPGHAACGPFAASGTIAAAVTACLTPRVREVASKTSSVAGDGTRTATILARAVVREGVKAVAAGMNPMDLKRGVDMAVEAEEGVVAGGGVALLFASKVLAGLSPAHRVARRRR